MADVLHFDLAFSKFISKEAVYKVACHRDLTRSFNILENAWNTAVDVRRLPCFPVFCFPEINMSVYKRVQQWATFTRVWHIYDAKWQNPFDSAKVISKHLMGLHKPIYNPIGNCGDHVVVINCKHIAMPGNEWKRRVYFHHTGYAGGASWTMAWELHKKDPSMIMHKAVYNSLPKNLTRHDRMQKLHLYDEENVPEHILRNVTSQIPQLRPVPRKLSSYSEQEIKEFPKIEDFKEDFILK